MFVQKNIKYYQFFIAGVLAFSLLSSCSQQRDDGGGMSAYSPVKESLLEGHYSAKFIPLNTAVSGVSIGKGKIQVMENFISIAIEMSDSPAMTIHSQAIYNAKECPTELSDTNKDGFLDSIELYAAVGKVLIPLDGDISGQEVGKDASPISDAMGSYVYYQETQLSAMMTDLFGPDMNQDDEIIKWNPSDKLFLDDKIIIIHGISEDVYLPGSVRAFGNYSERALLPIACAKIARGKVEEETEVGDGEGNL